MNIPCISRYIIENYRVSTLIADRLAFCVKDKLNDGLTIEEAVKECTLIGLREQSINNWT